MPTSSRGRSRARRPRRSGLAVLLVLLAMLAACGGPSDTGTQEWRDLEVTTPEGWQVFERRDTLLSMADGDLGPEGGDPGDRTVAAQFTYDPGAGADDWRQLITEAGGTIEVDDRLHLDGVPATRLVFSWVTNDVPTREMVVLVPARRLVLLFQPVPVAGQTDAPDVYLEHTDEFNAILESITFGAPVSSS